MKLIICTTDVSPLLANLLDADLNIIGLCRATKNQGSRKQKLTLTLSAWHQRLVKGREISIKQKAEQLKITFFELSEHNHGDFRSWLTELNPDLMIILSMPFLLKQQSYSIPNYGTINLHRSFLPKYKGPNPYFWQFHDMILTPGVSVHYVDEGEDTGDIIFQQRFNLPLGSLQEDFNSHASDLGFLLIMQTITSLEKGLAPKIKQNGEIRTLRARRISSHEHSSMINWESWPVERVFHLLRGTQEWFKGIPMPTGIYKGQHWEILSFKRESKLANESFKPGSILENGSKKYILCKDGTINIRPTLTFKGLVKGLLALD